MCWRRFRRTTCGLRCPRRQRDADVPRGHDFVGPTPWVPSPSPLPRGTVPSGHITLEPSALMLGTTPEEAHITASTNYLHVVLCHSVVLFVFMFMVWAWMLARWDFSPLKVLLLFGITGSLAEATINPTSLIGGFWVFVYGLMVYLPACTVPRDRGAKSLRWWHYPAAVFLPFLGVISGGLVATILRRLLQVQFLPGVE